jgi:hypothetical protein
VCDNGYLPRTSLNLMLLKTKDYLTVIISNTRELSTLRTLKGIDKIIPDGILQGNTLSFRAERKAARWSYIDSCRHVSSLHIHSCYVVFNAGNVDFGSMCISILKIPINHLVFQYIDTFCGCSWKNIYAEK